MNKSRYILWSAGLALALAIGYYFSDILAYILLAWVLSMLGRPISNFLQQRIRFKNWRLGPSAAAGITILVFYLLLTGLLLLFVPTIVQQARNLASVDYQALGEKWREPFAELDQSAHSLGLLSPEESLATRTQELLIGWFKPALVGDLLGGFLSTAGSLVVTLASVTFILFFFLKDNTLFTDILHALAPARLEGKVMRAVDESSAMLTRYFGGLVAQMAAFMTILSVSLLVMGVDNAPLIGAFGGLFNIVPYVGPAIGMVFSCFITVSSHLDQDIAHILPMLVKVLGAFALTQFIDNNFLGPLIFSKSVKAHPLEIFIVTLIAAKIGGVVGMIVGIPAYTVLRVIGRVFFSEFKVVQRLEAVSEEHTNMP